jgi:hypothetical protein
MARIGMLGKRWFGVASVAALAVGVMLVAPTGVAAAGGEQGELLIHGAGTVFAGPNAVPVVVTTAGAVATFTFEVANTGTSVAQYNLRAANLNNSCDPSGCPSATITVMAGSVNVTPSVTGPNGYFTAPIAAGKTATYTFKLTVPKTGVADNLYVARIGLFDTAGNSLSLETPVAEIKDTTGTSDFDQFFNGTGQPTVRVPGTTFSSGDGVSTTNVGLGQTAKFTVKLQNDSATPSVITYGLTELFGCSSFWQVTAMQGSVNVTSAVLAGTYQTPSLAHAASTVLTISMKLLSSPHACLGPNGDDQWQSTSSDSALNSGTGYLVANLTTAS